MTEPSVKGAMLLLSVVAIRRMKQGAELAGKEFEQSFSPQARSFLERVGDLPEGAFEKSLSAETLALLEEEIVITSWYPMWQFNELEEFLWVHLSKRDPELARMAGAEAFRSMQKTGRYQQLEYAERAGNATSSHDVIRQTRLIISILSSYYNFLEVEVDLDPVNRDLRITYDNAALICEPLRYSTEGFMTAVSRLRNDAVEWTSQRVSPDRIVFTLPNSRRQ